MKLQACIDELLKRGLDDWIQAAEVAFVAKSALGDFLSGNTSPSEAAPQTGEAYPAV
jgi:U3 small nucleolar ribonucleoprotein component